MIPLFVTQRADILKYDEKRDNLDQRWLSFLKQAGFLPIILPNDIDHVKETLKHVTAQGLLLTGGDSPEEYEGQTPERDQIEGYLIDWCLKNNLPMLGVCRGMQVMLHRDNVRLKKVKNHVAEKQTIKINDITETVNSYHNWATDQKSLPNWNIWASADDGIVKAIKHKNYNMTGIMWHPERIDPFREKDILLFQEIFNAKS